MNSSPYTWLMLAGIGVTLFTWSRIARRDQRLLFIYVGALLGAFVGAKVIYLLAEGWLHFGKPDMWLQLATGKSILGALLGGYGGVEVAKKMVGYSGVTGDWFAWIAPVGIIFGRIGCLLHGCCLGKICAPSWFALADATGTNRWPAVPVEILFNAIALVAFYWLRQRRLLIGQHFHLYLIAYGLFRFLHEFVRATPQVAGPFSGYHAAALALVLLGWIGFLRRMNEEPREECCSQS
jgi:phosphatidylglycerol:prolipoprotein diacylglycerol transferase